MNRIRERANAWRAGGYVSVTTTTRRLLGYWNNPGRDRKLFFYSPPDIACWVIDTNYNGESFFVRQAYFTGAEEPYEKLERALKAEIDEGTWVTLYSTVSRPFAPPDHGKIAVKVINHYGDEVLKVFEV